MAAENVTLPWDDQTDQFISAIDDLNSTENHYDIKIRELLLNPNDYITKPGAVQKIGELSKSVDDYFGGMLSNLNDEQRELDQVLANTDLYYSKMDSIIFDKAASARVPYVKPYFVYVNPDKREEIVIEKYYEELDMLLGKLTNGSDYVADLSGTYKEHKFGSWLFSGSKDYLLTIRAPTSIVMDIDRSSTLIKNMLNTVSESAKALQAPEK